MVNKLFEPIKIKNMQIINRVMRSATWDATADEYGAVTEQSMKIYRDLGKGNIGLIVSGHAYVSNPLGQATPRQYGIYSDDMIVGWKKIVKAVRNVGDSKIAMQIAHAGVNSGVLLERHLIPVAVSTPPKYQRSHHELTDPEIQNIINDFMAAAIRVREAGFDAVQLHGAHGYLISQFNSPIYNQRVDDWGGTPEKRQKFVLEVVAGVRKVIGDDFPLLIKFGLMDDQAGGMSLTQGIEIARIMVKLGVNSIEVSGGVGNVTTRTKECDFDRPVFCERAAELKKAVSVPVAVVNGIRSPQMANTIIESGKADIVSISRPFIREPHLVSRWAKGDLKAATCISCNKCFPIVGRGGQIECGEDRRIREEKLAVEK